MIPFIMKFAITDSHPLSNLKRQTRYEPVVEALIVDQPEGTSFVIEQECALQTFGSLNTNAAVDSTRDEPMDR